LRHISDEIRQICRIPQIDGTRREGGVGGAQVHGGIGFIWEHNLQLYYKRAKASEIVFGDANYHREEIARKVVDGDED
jgi:alkylation response protein AidB-like acyl-CoA dehydrogenase